ncbi:unnamed protein product, partial [Mesorhabditis belari]|uniref:Uncharacterized protein n=1 Tax=Mesorhabditis belari TaxID=2138241 RepID=A0AAF3ETY5_9BILA
MGAIDVVEIEVIGLKRKLGQNGVAFFLTPVGVNFIIIKALHSKILAYSEEHPGSFTQMLETKVLGLKQMGQFGKLKERVLKDSDASLLIEFANDEANLPTTN